MGTFHDKRYTAFFSIFLQLPSTNPLQNSKKKKLASLQHMNMAFKLNIIH